MKIDQTTGSAIPLRGPAKPHTAPARREAPATMQQPAVRLASEQDGEVCDADKVAAIREDIRAGRYKIDPARIADKMLAELTPAKKG